MKTNLPSFKIIQCLRENIYGFNIQMVNRFVKYHHMRLHHCHKCKYYATLLPSAQRVHALQSQLRGNSVATQERTVMLLIFAGIMSLQELNGTQIQIELFDVMLTELGQSHAPALNDVSRVRFQVLANDFQQGRLAHAVRADQGDPRVHVDVEVELLEQRLVGVVTERHVLERDDWGPTSW